MLQMRSLVLSAAARRKKAKGAAKSSLPVATDQGDAVANWRLEDGGYRRHARSPLVEPSIVRECLLLFDFQHHLRDPCHDFLCEEFQDFE